MNKACFHHKFNFYYTIRVKACFLSEWQNNVFKMWLPMISAATIDLQWRGYIIWKVAMWLNKRKATVCWTPKAPPSYDILYRTAEMKGERARHERWLWLILASFLLLAFLLLTLIISVGSRCFIFKGNCSPPWARYTNNHIDIRVSQW